VCYTVVIWTLFLLTLGNNILLQSFNWPKPVRYVPTDKINASIHICIWQILKVNIRIRWIRILITFVTSLTCSKVAQWQKCLWNSISQQHTTWLCRTTSDSCPRLNSDGFEVAKNVTQQHMHNNYCSLTSVNLTFMSVKLKNMDFITKEKKTKMVTE